MGHARRDANYAQMSEWSDAVDGLYVGGRSQVKDGESQDSDLLSRSSVLASAISEYVIFVRIQEVEAVALRSVQEMVAHPSLWSSLPDPFDLQLSSCAWRSRMDLVEQQSRQVTDYGLRGPIDRAGQRASEFTRAQMWIVLASGWVFGHV